MEDADVVRFDADHRSRLVYWDEGLFPIDGWVGMFSRHRTRVGVTWTTTTELRVRAVLANEFFSWYRARTIPDFTLNEIFFDNLYVKWIPDDLPFSVTAGRQNMRFGDGFIIMDGGPLDGSRSIYFNALRVDVEPAEGHDVTLFAMHQPVRDDLLPRINDAGRRLQEVPIDAAGVHYSCENLPLGAQAYFLASRSENEIPAHIGGGTLSKELYTPGIRLSGAITTALHMTAEGAIQLGQWEAAYQDEEHSTADYRSWAWHASLRWMPEFMAKQDFTLEAGFYQYSGGLISGGEMVIQNWNPLFGRWPIWSESFIYSLASFRGGIARWSNLAAPFARMTLRPTQHFILRAMLQHIRHANLGGMAYREPAIGTLAIGQIQLFSGQPVSGHVLIERLWYTDREPFLAANGYWWARAEVMYRWR